MCYFRFIILAFRPFLGRRSLGEVGWFFTGVLQEIPCEVTCKLGFATLSGHLSARRHREIGRSQHYGPAHQAAAGNGHDRNHNWSDVSDRSIIPNLRGLLPKEALVLIAGKRAAIAGGGGFWGEVLP